jgi:head-tail adaptor
MATHGAGSFRTPLWLQRPVLTHDAAGAPVYTWDATPSANTFKAWGSVQPLTGREFAGSPVTKDSADLRITVRRYSSMPVPDATWRVFDAINGVIYAVQSVLPAQNNATVDLVCRTAQGESDGR